MSTASREKALPSLPPGEFGANSLGLDADGAMTPTKPKLKGKQPMRPSLPPPSHFVPLQQPSPSRTEFLEPQRGYTSYSNLSPSPSPSKGPSVSGTSSPYAHSQHGSTSTLSAHSTVRTLTPPASPSTITGQSIRSMTTPTKSAFTPPAPSPLSSAADEYGRRGSEPGVQRQKLGFAALGKKRSSGQLLSGLGKGLGRMGSVVRRTASDGSASLLASARAPDSPDGGSLGRGRMGWRSKSKRQDSLKEVDEGYEAEAPPAPISKRSEMELGDEGIGLPFNVEHDLHVSPDLDDLPPAWLETLKRQGLSEQDLLLITAARNRQADSSRKASKITDTHLHRPSQSSTPPSETDGRAGSLGVERAPTLKKFSFEPGPSPSESPDPFEIGGEVVAEPFSFYTSLNETETSLPSRADSSSSPRDDDDDDDKPLALLQPQTSKNDKRLSDQLRHFSQLKLGDDESWSASLLGPFAEEPHDEAHEVSPKTGSMWTMQDQAAPLTPVPPQKHELQRDNALFTSQAAGVADRPSTFIASPISPLGPSPLACSHLFQSLRDPEKDLYSQLTPASTPTRSPAVRRLPTPTKPLGPRPPPRSPVPTQASPGPSIPSSHSSRLQSPSTPQHRTQAPDPHYPVHEQSQSSIDIDIVTPSASYPARDTESAASETESSGYEDDTYEQSSDLDLVEAMIADRYPESLASDRVKEYKMDDSSPRYLSPAPDKGHPFLPQRLSPLTSDSREASRVEDELVPEELHRDKYDRPAILSPIPQRVGVPLQLDGKPRSQRSSLPASASSSVLLSPSPSSDPLPLPSNAWNHAEAKHYEHHHDRTNHQDHHDRYNTHDNHDERPVSHDDWLLRDSNYRASDADDIDTRHHSRTSMFSYISSEGSNLHASVHEATVQLAYAKLLSGFRSPIGHALSISRRQSISQPVPPSLISSHRGSISSGRFPHSRDSKDVRSAPAYPEGVEEGTETDSDAGCSALDALDEAARTIAGASRGSGLHSGFVSPQRYSPGNLSMFEDADEEELTTPRKMGV